ncbi:MAG: endonuclease [Bacteroidaceae bacterium]|nr:endonuclease [Bacteroidaceae bacterium]
MKYKFSLLTAAFLLLGILSSEAKGNKLRLLYWNIQNGMWDGQTDDYQRFTNWVDSQKPDICVWCEAQKLYLTKTAKSERETESEMMDRWKRLAARYGHQYVYLSAHPDNYPQLITSKYPMESEKLISGNQDTLVCHGASWYKVQIGKNLLNLVTLHTWPQGYGYGVPQKDREKSRAKGGGDKFRRVEMEYICKHTINSHPKAKKELWAMMGDFNSVSRVDNDVYKLPDNATGLLVHDYIREHTPYVDLIKALYPGQFIPSVGGKDHRIDFMYVTPALQKKVADASIVWDSYTTPVRNDEKISNFWHPSDHCPILVNFNF